jgi:hypothetical protein
MIRQFIPRCLLAALALAPIACGRLQGREESPARPPYELSPDEIRLARELAERDMNIPAKPLSPLERVVFTKIDLLPDSQAETTMRQVIVHHYRYRGDEVVLTTVDLNRLEVLSTETIPHFPSALAREELVRAEHMAQSDARIKHVFEEPGRSLKIEGRLPYFPSSHALFGHRVVQLLLRNGADYLSSPRVLVDLSTETVIVE